MLASKELNPSRGQSVIPKKEKEIRVKTRQVQKSFRALPRVFFEVLDEYESIQSEWHYSDFRMVPSTMEFLVRHIED